MARIEIPVEMTNVYEYQKPGYFYGMMDAYIYTMTGEDGKVYVWKTTSWMSIKVESTKGNSSEYDSVNNKWYRYDPVGKGDKLIITASIKGESEYKGQPQTELTRVKVKERTYRAETWEEAMARREAEKAQKEKDQRESLRGKDFVWRMPYKQYKEHYSDCETVEGSFERTMRGCYIDVIVREGRLKPSGVRGKHFYGFVLQTAEGKQIVYRAVSEENARRQAKKDFPGQTLDCVKIY